MAVERTENIGKISQVYPTVKTVAIYNTVFAALKSLAYMSAHLVDKINKRTQEMRMENDEANKVSSINAQNKRNPTSHKVADIAPTSIFTTFC